MPSVRVLLFSILKEKTGHSSIELELPGGATASEAVDRVLHGHENLESLRPHIRIAVNCIYSDATCELKDGDELALITPVSGG